MFNEIEQYKKVWQLFKAPESCIEIRGILHRSGSSRAWDGWARNSVSGYFDNEEDFIKSAAELNATGLCEGIYFTFNPVKPDLLARAKNRLVASKSTTSDEDISCRHWLMIDFDPKRPKGISATDDELKLAAGRARDCRDWLTSKGWPLPVSAISGNGVHLLYRIHLENTGDNAAMLRHVLSAIALDFSDDMVEVDQKVFNAARITKLYGTVARKGDQTEDRPHRYSQIKTVPDEIQPVSIPLLKELAAIHEEHVANERDKRARTVTAVAGDDWMPQDFIREAISKHPNERNNGGLWLACQLRDQGYSESDAEPVMIEYANSVDPNGYSESNALASLRQAFKRAPREAREAKRSVDFYSSELIDAESPTAESLNFLQGKSDSQTDRWDYGYDRTAPVRRDEAVPFCEYKVVLECLGGHEHGDAKLFEIIYGKRCIYDSSEKKWYIWAGHHWQRDTSNIMPLLVSNQLASQYLNAIAAVRRTGETEEDKALIKNLQKRANDLKGILRAKRILEYCSSMMSIPGSQWDSDGWLLPVENGVIDLRVGNIRAGLPTDYVRTVAPVEYDSDARCPLWEQVVSDAMAGDASMYAYIQRLFGYSILGGNREHILPIFWGAGRNGKDTLTNAIFHVLGPLAGPADEEVLIAKDKNNGGASPHIMALRALRIAVCNETEKSDKLKTAQVKKLTGGGKISARQLYEGMTQFDQQHTLFLMTNHRPMIQADDFAIWQRIKLIEFKMRFVDNPQGPYERKKDKTLEEKLRKEAAGILNWLVAGCLDYQENGLDEPDQVTQATEEYQKEQDTIGLFIQEACITGSDMAGSPHQIKASELYSEYKQWCNDSGFHPLNMRNFGTDMGKRHEKRRTGGGIFYVGIAKGEEMNIESPTVEHMRFINEGIQVGDVVL